MNRYQPPRRAAQSEGEQVFSVNIISTVIAILAAVLLGWGVSLIANPMVESTVGIVAGGLVAIYLGIGANTGNSRSATVIKSVSGFAAVVSLVVTAILALVCYNYKVIIIVDGLLLLAYLSSVAFVAKSRQ